MRIGIDLGGTKTEVIALGDAGEQLYRHRLPRRVMITGRLLKRSPRWLIWRSRRQGSAERWVWAFLLNFALHRVVKMPIQPGSTVSHSIKT
ncbi:hypothetical protein ACVXG9_00275 [Escherichia coli]